MWNTYLVKSFVANVTLVCLFTRMSEAMILVVSFLMKSFPTVFANPRFVPIVYSHVRVQGGTSVECFTAGHAFVWLLVGVDNFVSAKCRGLSESFSTHLAYKWPCSWK